MSTMRELADRLFRTILTPPDFQYAQVQLAVSIPDGTTETITLGDFTIPEDANLLRQGSVIEAGDELMRVVSYDETTKVATVQRGEYSTPATAHSVPLLLNLSPSYPRYSVFEALNDNIIQLYPRLFTTRTEALASVSGNVFPVKDDLVVELVEAWPDQGTQDINFDGRVVEFHPQAGGRAIVLNVPVGTIWARYRRRMAVATDWEDDLDDLGVEEVWATCVMVGAAADLMAGRDIPAAQTEWVGQVLQAENIQVGTRSSLSVGLARYRELLIARFAKEMRGEDSNRPKVHYNEPFRTVT